MRGNIYSLGQLSRWLPALLLLLFATHLLAAAVSPGPAFPPPKPAGPLFKQRPFGPVPEATTPPAKAYQADEKPIPREWLIGGGITLVLLIAGVLYGSARAWRSHDLFDQQYRFPPNRQPALRLGGPRNGGHMATLRGDELPDRKPIATSKTKDA